MGACSQTVPSYHLKLFNPALSVQVSQMFTWPD